MTDIRNKTAFITGGASGIGLALARALLAAGANTVIADVEAGALERAQQTLDAPADRLMTCVLDVTDRAAFANARDAAVDAMGGVQLYAVRTGRDGAASPARRPTPAPRQSPRSAWGARRRGSAAPRATPRSA